MDAETGYTRAQSLVVDAAKHAMRNQVGKMVDTPAEELQLCLIAAIGLFCDTIAGLPPRAAPPMVEVINRFIAPAGWQLVRCGEPRPRFS